MHVESQELLMDCGCQGFPTHFTVEESEAQTGASGILSGSAQFYRHLYGPTMCFLWGDGGDMAEVTACPTQAATLSSQRGKPAVKGVRTATGFQFES